jgi:phospholipid/cholesterol/gamma-HCH transport system ATP-binding protein
LKKQIQVCKGMPERKAVKRRQERVQEMMHTLPQEVQEATLTDLRKNESGARSGTHRGQDAPTQEFPRIAG